jgi:hypothetical protein
MPPLSSQTENGLRWVTAQVRTIADEVGLALDCEPEWDREDQLNFKLAVATGGQSKILRLWAPNIDDSQGGNNPATQEVQQKLRNQIRELVQLFAPPKRPVGF